jgi:hypothetical protein
MIAFFGGMMLTFGITGLDFENPAFDANLREYVVLGIGAAMLIIAFVLKAKSPKY